MINFEACWQFSFIKFNEYFFFFILKFLEMIIAIRVDCTIIIPWWLDVLLFMRMQVITWLVCCLILNMKYIFCFQGVLRWVFMEKLFLRQQVFGRFFWISTSVSLPVAYWSFFHFFFLAENFRALCTGMMMASSSVFFILRPFSFFE